ncbi:mariner Mos1 transposase [Trichonephila clavipes]|nr:mariner Mos1 transposase [Trichonephila clavipes]
MGTTQANGLSTGKSKTRVRNVAYPLQTQVISPSFVTGDENWIYFENTKRNRLYVDPGQPSKSTTRLNHFDRKTMLCIFWDQEGRIYYELLKPSGTVNIDRYKQQLLYLNDAILEKHEQYEKRSTK